MWGLAIQYDKEEIDKLYTQSQQRQEQLNTAMEQLEVEIHNSGEFKFVT